MAEKLRLNPDSVAESERISRERERELGAKIEQVIELEEQRNNDLAYLEKIEKSIEKTQNEIAAEEAKIEAAKEILNRGAETQEQYTEAHNTIRDAEENLANLRQELANRQNNPEYVEKRYRTSEQKIEMSQAPAEAAGEEVSEQPVGGYDRFGQPALSVDTQENLNAEQPVEGVTSEGAAEVFADDPLKAVKEILNGRDLDMALSQMRQDLAQKQNELAMVEAFAQRVDNVMNDDRFDLDGVMTRDQVVESLLDGTFTKKLEQSGAIEIADDGGTPEASEGEPTAEDMASLNEIASADSFETEQATESQEVANAKSGDLADFYGPEVRAIYEKIAKREKLKKAFQQKAKRALIKATVFGMAALSGLGLISRKGTAQGSVDQNPAIETSANLGAQAGESYYATFNEQDANAFENVDMTKDTRHEAMNGTKYDYSSEFGSTEKHGQNGFGVDKSEDWGDEQKTRAGIMDMASLQPEALASYISVMPKAILEAGGYTGTTDYRELDEALSNGGNGGQLQEQLTGILQNALENATFDYYEEYGSERSFYMTKIDPNGANTPGNILLGLDEFVQRNGEKQVKVVFMLNGQAVGTMDLNQACGYQPNLKVDIIEESDDEDDDDDDDDKSKKKKSSSTQTEKEDGNDGGDNGGGDEEDDGGEDDSNPDNPTKPDTEPEKPTKPETTGPETTTQTTTEPDSLPAKNEQAQAENAVNGDNGSSVEKTDNVENTGPKTEKQEISEDKTQEIAENAGAAIGATKEEQEAGHQAQVDALLNENTHDMTQDELDEYMRNLLSTVQSNLQ